MLMTKTNLVLPNKQKYPNAPLSLTMCSFFADLEKKKNEFTLQYHTNGKLHTAEASSHHSILVTQDGMTRVKDSLLHRIYAL